MEIKHKELEEFIRKAVETNCSLFIHGTTGIGKSYTVLEQAKFIAEKAGKTFVDWNRTQDTEKENFVSGGEFTKGGKTVQLTAEEYRDTHYIFVDVRISQMDPADLRGLPNFSAHSGYVEWKPNLDFWVLSRPETSAILFLDEMNLAAPSVQAAAYQIIRDRCIGQISLSEHVGVLSAGNTANDRANVFEMAAPLKNRFMHVTLRVPGVDEWADDFAFEADIDPRIISFLKFRPGQLMANEKIIQDSKTSAFPTPRTWEMTSRMIEGVTDARKAGLFASACIGEASSREFKTFLLAHNNIGIEEILKNPSLIKGMDLQAKWVLVSAAAERYRANKRNIKEVVDLCGILNREDKDFSISLLRMAKQYNKSGFLPAIKKHPEAMAMVGEYFKYLQTPTK